MYPFSGGSLKGIQFPVGENLYSRGVFILAYLVRGITSKGIVTDYMGVPVPLGTFTKGEPHFIDVRFLVGHNTSMIPLARSRNNNENSTMQLMVTDQSMNIRVNLDTENNAEARALYSAVKRGDMTGMSFMFVVDKDSWADADSDYPKREILSIRKVFEVSAVAFPAYPQTSIQAASEDATLDSARASLESARQQLAEERAKQAEDERRMAALERLNNLIKEVKHDEV